MNEAFVDRSRTIEVLIADDQALVRAGLASLVASQPDLAVVGQAADGAEAVRLARQLTPDVVLMDIRMPALDGIEATRRITTDPATRHCRVLILTTYDVDEYVYDALKAGASGFLLKHSPPEELILGVHAAADGGALASPSITKRLIEAFTAGRNAPVRPPAVLARLTVREREVFDQMITGSTNAEIAQALFIGETTVKTHAGHVLDKLELRDRVQVVVFAYENGLVLPGTSARSYRDTSSRHIDESESSPG